MNKLELATELREVCGISGSESTTANASGEWLVLVNAINRAWESIQRDREDWLWMRKPVQFNTIANQGEYVIDAAPLSLTDFARWDKSTFRIYQTSVNDELPMNYMQYPYFRDYWLYGALRGLRYRPNDFTVSPSKSIILGPVPDSGYTITADYYKTPSTLSADGNSPDMPARFHRLIIFEAMKFIGMRESAQEIFEYGRSEATRLRFELERDQLPEISIVR